MANTIIHSGTRSRETFNSDAQLPTRIFSPSPTFLLTMHLKHLSFFSAVLSTATVAIAQEVHNNVTYEVRWNFTEAAQTTGIKDAYEQAAAEEASVRIQQAINTVRYPFFRRDYP